MQSFVSDLSSSYSNAVCACRYVHDDVSVGEADDQAVLGRIVLVLGLGDQALAGIVVGLALLPPLVLGLEAAARLSVLIVLSSSYSITEKK